MDQYLRSDYPLSLSIKIRQSVSRKMDVFFMVIYLKEQFALRKSQ